MPVNDDNCDSNRRTGATQYLKIDCNALQLHSRWPVCQMCAELQTFENISKICGKIQRNTSKYFE